MMCRRHQEKVRRRVATRAAAWLAAGAALAASAARADAIRVDVDIQPAVVAAGETAHLRWVVHDRVDAPRPEWEAAAHVDIRFAGATREHALRNGQQTRAVIYSFMVSANTPGEHPLTPRPYRVDGRRIPVEPVILRVREAGAAAADGPDRLRARIRVEREVFYLQESFGVVIELAHRDINLDPSVRLEGLSGGGIEWGPFQELAGDRIRIDGALYDVRRFRARARALAPGQVTLAPTVEVHERVRARARSPSPLDGMPSMFDDFFGGRVEHRPIRVPVEPVTFEVRPLPEEGRPEAFAGAVGRFAFEVEVDRDTARVGEPVALRMVLEGEGNPDLLRAPPIPETDAFRVYEPRLVERRIDAARGSGRKVFDVVLVPRRADVEHIPALTFAWFDPEAGVYRHVSRGPFALRVEPAEEAPSAVVRGAPGERRDPEPGPARDLRYLHPPPARWRGPAAEASGILRLVRMALDAAPLLAAAALVLAGTRRERMARDEAFARRVRAPRVARHALRAAAAAVRAHDGRGFLDGVWDALATYFGNRLNLAPGEVTPDRIIKAVREAGMRPERIAEWRRRLREWEAGRFGGGDAEAALAEADTTLGALRELLRESERLRWR